MIGCKKWRRLDAEGPRAALGERIIEESAEGQASARVFALEVYPVVIAAFDEKIYVTEDVNRGNGQVRVGRNRLEPSEKNGPTFEARPPRGVTVRATCKV